jgi:hypothetical protein
MAARTELSIIAVTVLLSLALWLYMRQRRRRGRCAILMVAIDFSPAEVTAPAWQAYADRHGYEFVLMDDAKYDDKALGVAWWRVRIVRDMLASGEYSAVMHVDADTVPVRPDITIEQWMASHGGPDTSMWLSSDYASHGHAFGSVNFGVFVMKADAFCMNLLKSMWGERYQRTEWPREQGCAEDKLQSLFAAKKSVFHRHVHISAYGEMQHFKPSTALQRSWVFHAAGRDVPRIHTVLARAMPTVRQRLAST